MLEMVELSLVLVEPAFEAAGFGIGGGDRAAFRQAQLDIELEARRIGEKLLLHLAHADD